MEGEINAALILLKILAGRFQNTVLMTSSLLLPVSEFAPILAGPTISGKA